MTRPTPIETKMDKRYRWDRFITPEEAAAWLKSRKKEGHRAGQYGGEVGVWVWWDQTVRPVTRIAYPKMKVDHCRHCEERLTLIRTGSGKRVSKSKDLYKRGRRDFWYVQEPKHSCPGTVAEAQAHARVVKRLGEMIRRMR